MAYDWGMRTFRLLVLAAVVAAPGGCHLIFPFDLDDAGGAPSEGGPPDGSAVDVKVPQDLVSDAHAQDLSKLKKELGIAPLDGNLIKPKWTQMTVTGATWPPTTTPVIWGIDDQQIFIAAYKSIFRCSDGGKGTLSCTPITTSAAEVIYDLGGYGSEVLAVGHNNLVLAKSKAWNDNLTDAFPYAFYSVWCRSATNCVLAGKRLSGATNAVAGIFANGVFTPVPNGSKQFNGAWRHASGAWVAVGPDCQVYHYTPGGTWTAGKPCVSANLLDVWGASDTAIHVVGSGGVRLHWGKSGGWKQLTTPTVGDLNAIWGADVANVYAVGKSGTVLRYNGTAWTGPLNGPFGAANLTDVWGTGKSRIYVVAPNTLVFRYGS